MEDGGSQAGKRRRSGGREGATGEGRKRGSRMEGGNGSRIEDGGSRMAAREGME